MNTLTQKQQVLAWLQSGKVLTPIEALNHIGSFRVGARIFELRQQGYNIINENKTGGENYAKYRLVSESSIGAAQSKINLGGETGCKTDGVKPTTDTVAINSVTVDWRQVDTPCSVCGSFYLVGGKCNKCNANYFGIK